MDVPKNVGPLDRIVRGVLGIWLLAVSISAIFERKLVTAAIAAIAGAGLVRNAQSAHCTGNLLFGIDTTSESKAGEK